MMKKWLETVSDPHNRNDIPAGTREILIMDGHDTDVHINLLDAYSTRVIDRVILPASLTSIVQLFDIASCKRLKYTYDSECNDKIGVLSYRDPSHK